MQIETINSVEQLVSLQPAWNQAVELSMFDSVFATYEWFYAWVKNFSKNGAICLVVALDNERIKGIAPLMIEKKRIYGMEFKILRSQSNFNSYKYDLILEPKDGPDVLKGMLAHISRELNWDILQLSYLPADAQSVNLLKQHQGKVFYKMYCDLHMQSPYVEIKGSWENYLQQRSKKFRRNLDYFEQRLEKSGTVELRCIEEGDDLETHVLEAFRIEQSSWKGEQRTAIADSTHETNFYLDLARAMSREGRFALYFLVLNGEKIAFDYCLKYKEYFNVLKTGYNPAYAKHSPGRILRKKILKNLFQEQRYRIYDLLGAQDQWKAEWTNVASTLCRVFVFNKKPAPALLYHFMDGSTALKESIRKNPGAYRFLKDVNERLLQLAARIW